jgi:hypothetical protein
MPLSRRATRRLRCSRFSPYAEGPRQRWCTVQSGIEISESHFSQCTLHLDLVLPIGVSRSFSVPSFVRFETWADRVQFVQHEACAYNIRDGSGGCHVAAQLGIRRLSLLMDLGVSKVLVNTPPA